MLPRRLLALAIHANWPLTCAISCLRLRSTPIVIGIIGGTGFLGLNLSWRFQSEAVPCRTFSRNGLLLHPSSVSYRDLSKVEHVRGDFRDRLAVNEFVKPCRRVVVLVSHLLPSSSPEEIETVISWFSVAFVQLLESCLGSQLEQFL